MGGTLQIVKSGREQSLAVRFDATETEMAVAQRCHEEYGADIHRMFALAREWNVGIGEFEALYALRNRAEGVSIGGLVRLMRRLGCNAASVVELIDEAAGYYGDDYGETLKCIGEIVTYYESRSPADVITALEVIHAEYDTDEDEWVLG